MIVHSNNQTTVDIACSTDFIELNLHGYDLNLKRLKPLFGFIFYGYRSKLEMIFVFMTNIVADIPFSGVFFNSKYKGSPAGLHPKSTSSSGQLHFLILSSYAKPGSQGSEYGAPCSHFTQLVLQAEPSENRPN